MTILQDRPTRRCESRATSRSAGADVVRVCPRRAAFLLGGILVVFVVLQGLLPLATAVKIGADEGFELAKVPLALKGYQFYTEVWNDQPLLHTYIIKQIASRVSPSVLGPRLVTSVSAVLLLASVFLIALRTNGLLVAGLTAALLIASPGFLELSASCMVEVPALAPAVAGICVLVAFPQHKWYFTALAGAFFGAAFQVKFINVILLPLVALVLWQRLAGNQPRPQLFAQSLATFAGGLVTMFFTIHFIVNEGSYWAQLQQSWSAHFASARSFEYGSPADHPFEWSVLLKNWDVTLPALLGAGIILTQFRMSPLAVLPLAWCVLELVVFGIHRPWWSYYYVHNAVPICWCAAIGFAAVFHKWERRNEKKESFPRAAFVLFVVFALCAAAWMGSRVYLQMAEIRSSPRLYYSLVLKEIERFKPFTKFLYTDEPVYSFHSGIPMPPRLAIVSLKRLWSGDLTNEKINAELARVKPGLMLLANESHALPFQDLLTSEYRLVYQDDKLRLYALKSIAAQAKY